MSLSLAGLFRYPFCPVAEKQVEIVVEEKDELVRGRIDVLVLHQQLWVTVIESKSKRFSLSEALPQALFYMLNSPNPSQPTLGLVTNGSHFMFIKLMRQDTLQYGLSDEFTLRRRGNELYEVLGVLKRWVTLLS